MKKLYTILLLMTGVTYTQAQTLGGIFSQGTTELKNSSAQLLALQNLETANQQGYEDDENGLTTIAGVHGAEYALHQQYFASLHTINPQIAAMPEINEIKTMIPALNAMITKAIAAWTTSGRLNPAELAAMSTLKTNLGDVGQNNLTNLQSLIVSGMLTMSDPQRIQAIRKLHKEVEEQYAFVVQICTEGDLLIANRKRP